MNDKLIQGWFIGSVFGISAGILSQIINNTIGYLVYLTLILLGFSLIIYLDKEKKKC